MDGINLGRLLPYFCMPSTEYLGVEKAITFGHLGPYSWKDLRRQEHTTLLQDLAATWAPPRSGSEWVVLFAVRNEACWASHPSRACEDLVMALSCLDQESAWKLRWVN